MSERWLVTGARGQLGGHIVRLLAGDPLVMAIGGFGRSDGPDSIESIIRKAPRADGLAPMAEGGMVDFEDAGGAVDYLMNFGATHIIHTAAMTTVAECLEAPDRAMRVNGVAPGVMARSAGRQGIRFVQVSTDMVFDGAAAPYDETSTPRPLSHYGRTKLNGEDAVRRAGGVVARVPLLIGLPCTPRRNTYGEQLAAPRAGRPLRLFVDEFRTPLWLEDAARMLIRLARSEVIDVIHLAGPRRLSRYEIMAEAAAALGIAQPNLEPVSRLSIASPEPRPADLSLEAFRFHDLFPGESLASAFEVARHGGATLDASR